LQSLAHSVCTCIREGEAQDVLRLHIRLQEDFTDAGGKDVGFARAWACNDEDRAFDLLDGGALGRV
jgi:hypothetical protein